MSLSALSSSCMGFCSSLDGFGGVFGRSAQPVMQPRGLPQYLDGPHPHGSRFPWGEKTAVNTNPYKMDQIPNTGMTRTYHWNIGNHTVAPDGVPIPGILVDGQWPGPMVEANWGDTIEIHVTNDLVTEGTSLHWHGFLQSNSPWYDGVPGISQCPIAPGKTFTYRFRAELYGTSWWHGHYSSQYVNGLSGPIIIHGPSSDSEYDIDVGPVMLADHFHDYYTDLILQIYKGSPSCDPECLPLSKNLLINGRGEYDCSKTGKACSNTGGLAMFHFETEKRHRLRLINHGTEALLFFSIDGYTMTVISNDFVPVVPYEADVITLSVGQRTDVIVQGRKDPKEAVWMRVTTGPSAISDQIGAGCSLSEGNLVTLAAIYYEEADKSKSPNSTTIIDHERYGAPGACGNQPLGLTVPSYPIPVAKPDMTVDIVMTANYNDTGSFTWYMNGQTYVADYNDPSLFEAKLANATTKPQPNRPSVDLGKANIVRINMTTVGIPISHPMHLHGHNMQILAEGDGYWDGKTIINKNNPARRDTQIIRADGYLVVQVETKNPGVWPLHCHVAWHASQGMSINMVEQSAKLKQMDMPYVMAQTCRDWSTWSGKHMVEQIDSGL